FSWVNSDTPLTLERSTRWRYDIGREDAMKFPFFGDVLDMVGEHYGNLGVEISSIYANLNFFGEMFFPHTDELEGLTALYYVNPTWKSEWQAETVFFEDGNPDEPTHVIFPKPGRLIVFNARLLHRGSAPSRECTQPRMSIAFKFQSTDAAKIAELQQ